MSAKKLTLTLHASTAYNLLQRSRAIAMHLKVPRAVRTTAFATLVALHLGCGQAQLPAPMDDHSRGADRGTTLTRQTKSAETRTKDRQWILPSVDGPVLGFGGLSGAESAKRVRIFFGTSRKLNPVNEAEYKISDDRADSLTLGYCVVSIPPTHTVGQIERPVWFLSPRRERHFFLEEIQAVESFYFKLLLADEANSTPRKRALIYVHGIANSFQDPAFRAAQLKVDLGLDGPVIFFSWPSGRRPTDYLVADNNADWSAAHLSELIKYTLDDLAIPNVVLIAHSKGAKVATMALNKLGKQRDQVIDLVLASPDIDAQIFHRDIAPVLLRKISRLTIYASRRDQALQWSQWAAGGQRLGLAQSGRSSSSQIEVIDTTFVSSADTFLHAGHSDYAESRPALIDLAYLINEKLPATNRVGLERILASGTEYWRIKK